MVAQTGYYIRCFSSSSKNPRQGNSSLHTPFLKFGVDILTSVLLNVNILTSVLLNVNILTFVLLMFSWHRAVIVLFPFGDYQGDGNYRACGGVFEKYPE
jgi:hypothetical protein